MAEKIDGGTEVKRVLEERIMDRNGDGEIKEIGNGVIVLQT